MEFSRALRDTRQRMGITQAEMAKKLGVARASLSLYESGKQTPDLNFLDTLHKETGAPLEYLMGYTDNYTPETLGIDKELGLSTESIQQLKHMSAGVKSLIDSIIKSPRLKQWIDIALRAASLTYTYNNYVMGKKHLDAGQFQTPITIYQKQLGEITAQAIAENPNNHDLLVKNSILSIYEIIAIIFHSAAEGEQKEILAEWTEFIKDRPDLDAFIQAVLDTKEE
ncbi:MAG: helix-turn-helix domain-containing protein [Clostridiales bacterium]|nr:helix-turn-helix domain-containing protein [Clostridiales bacterium]